CLVICASRLSSAGACNVSISIVPLIPPPKSSSTSRSAAASLFRMITDVCPPGSFAAYAVASTPASASFVGNSVFNSVPPLNEPANLSPYATGSNRYSEPNVAIGVQKGCGCAATCSAVLPFACRSAPLGNDPPTELATDLPVPPCRLTPE